MPRSKNRFYADPLRVLPERFGGVEVVYAADYDKLFDLLDKVMDMASDELHDADRETYLEVLDVVR